MLGKSITLHGKSYPVVGVMPPGFNFPDESDLWIPMTVPTTFATFEPFRGFLPSHVIARMRPGVAIEAVAAQVIARWAQVAEPASGDDRVRLNEFIDELRHAGAAIPLRRQLLGDRRSALLTLFGATALLLMIACANVANLLLSDAAVRRREIAVREVLGATRPRIIRQLLAESMLLALAGGIVGILLSPAALTMLRAMMPPTLAGVAPAELDVRVLAFAAALAIATTIVFGLWPAIGATRGDATMAIKSRRGTWRDGGRRQRATRAGGRRGWADRDAARRGGPDASQLRAAHAENTGMNPENVATLETSFPRNTSDVERRRIINGVIDRLSGQPGIVAAGAVNDLPLRGGGGIR